MDEKDMDRSSHKEKVEQKRVNGRNIADKIMKSALVPVSYTHLTLPTIA